MRKQLALLWSDIRGGAIMEAAAFMPLLLIAYMGVIEITQYLNAKERVNRLLNQTSDLFVGSQTAAEVTESWNAVVALRRVVAAPNDIAVSLRFCSAASGPGTTYTIPSPTSTYGQCGALSTGVTGATITSIPCPVVNDPCPSGSVDCYRPGFSEMIRLRVACRYRPFINWLNLFPDGIAIDSGHVDVPLPRSS